LLKVGEPDGFCEISLEPGFAGEVTIGLCVVIDERNETQFPPGSLIAQARSEAISAHLGQLQAKQYDRW
jgi:hypothetical protein